MNEAVAVPVPNTETVDKYCEHIRRSAADLLESLVEDLQSGLDLGSRVPPLPEETQNRLNTTLKTLDEFTNTCRKLAHKEET